MVDLSTESTFLVGYHSSSFIDTAIVLDKPYMICSRRVQFSKTFSATGSTLVRCTLDDVSNLTGDPIAYGRIDPRVASVERVVRVGHDELRVWYRPCLPGSSAREPVVEARYLFSSSGHRRQLDQRLAPWPANRLNHLIGEYRARLVWYPATGGCLIEREVHYRLRWLPRLVIGPVLRRGLAASVEAELTAVRDCLEG